MYATPVEATLTEIHTSLIKWFNYNFSLKEMAKTQVSDFFILKNSVHLMWNSSYDNDFLLTWQKEPYADE